MSKLPFFAYNAELSGARLAVFEMVHHGVTSLLEVEEMNAIHQDLDN
jgi:hypothetical protein